MFRRPIYLPLFVGIWSVPLVITLVVAPLPNGLFALVVPRFGEAMTLGEMRAVDTLPFCVTSGKLYWQRIATDAEAREWFTFLVREGPRAAGRYYGLVGLHAIDHQLARQALHRLPGPLAVEPVPVIDSLPIAELGVHETPLALLSDSVTLTRMARALSERDSTGRCE